MHPHSLSLQVEPLSAGSVFNESVATNDRSVSGDHAQSKRRHKCAPPGRRPIQHQRFHRDFRPQLRGTVPDTAQVEWYFVAANPPIWIPASRPSTRRYVFDKGSQAVNLGAGGTSKIPVTSKEITSETTRKAGFHTGKFHEHAQRR